MKEQKKSKPKSRIPQILKFLTDAIVERASSQEMGIFTWASPSLPPQTPTTTNYFPNLHQLCQFIAYWLISSLVITQSDPHLDGTDSLKRQIECTRALVVDETAAAASASAYAGLLIEWLTALPEPVIPTKF